MKCNKSSKIFVFLMASIILLLFFKSPIHAESEDKKSVLILNSYGNDSTIISGNTSTNWTSEIIASINSELVDSNKNINIKIQYMDSYDILEEEYWQKLYDLCKYKFKNTKFDVVIALDDNAFDFLTRYGDALFPNTPVVFSGINNYNNSKFSGHPLFTGLVKSADIQGTIDIALRLHPDTKQVFVIIDKTLNGAKKRVTIESMMSTYGNINFIFSDEQDIMKVKEEINKLSSNAIIYYDARFKDEEGKSISQEKVSDFLFKDIDIPVYSKSIEMLKYGSVGGVITYGNTLGQEIGRIVLKILDGEKVQNIPITEDSSHKYTFNYDELRKFNIDIEALPKDSEIIYKPSKYYNISKKILLYAFAFIIFVILLIAVFTSFNIHKRRLAERLLSENENLLSTLINATPDIIYFIGDDDKLLELNNAALKLLGINKRDYKNKKVHELTNLSKHAKSILINWKAKDEVAWRTKGINRSEEIILDNEEKADKIFDTLRIPLFNDNGTRKGMVLLGRDITEKKQIEKNEQLIKDLLYYDKLKANFFSNLSHELKTPLNLIFSTMQVIELRTNLNKENDGYLDKYIGIMRQNCYRLLRIINNLIDITKIDAGHFFTNFQNNDIVNIVENIVLSVADYVENKGIAIIFDTELEEKIMAFDLDAMERMLLNLISNAIKFTPSGGSIEVNIYDKRDSIVISVKDSGIGIPIDKQASIFEKFVQVDKSLSRNREGSGIGLSLVKELVGLHGGTIELVSAPDKGSEFRIMMPVKLLEEDGSEEFTAYTRDEKVERIKIEFSDIYN